MRLVSPIATRAWCHSISLDITLHHERTVPKLSQDPLAVQAGGHTKPLPAEPNTDCTSAVEGMERRRHAARSDLVQHRWIGRQLVVKLRCYATVDQPGGVGALTLSGCTF